MSLAAPDIPLPEVDVKDRFLNRDLAWLEFNRRVLHEAMDERNPVLERVRFLAIFTSNLDEFFMKRVGWHRRHLKANPTLPVSPDGRTAPQVLAAIREAVLQDLARQAEHYTSKLRPDLRARGVHLCGWADLSEEERRAGSAYFESSVFPVLTPLAVDEGAPFPFISNLSLSLGVRLRHPDRPEPVFARVKVPEVLPKWVRVSPPGAMPVRLVPMYELIHVHLAELFTDMEILSVMPFRVTRNAEVSLDEDDADDIRELMEEELRQRRFAEVVRLETGPDPDPWMLGFLKQELQLTDADCYQLPAEVDYEDLKVVADLPLAALRYEPWTPVVPHALAGQDADIFTVIRRGDLLVHHPYESFDASVGRFVDAATADPKVLAIKMTLYRVGDSTPFIKSLIRAAEQGKQVVVLIELKARFDEERNIRLADQLERAGAHVLYGVVGLKTHGKVTLVVREETEPPTETAACATPASGASASATTAGETSAPPQPLPVIRAYAHIGTGNYNATTARLYTDLGLFTADPAITRDVIELFHYLTGRSLKRTYRKLLVAPANLRGRIIELIDREAEHAKAGRPARIIAKMNQLEERKVCNALYAASRAGVQIDLIVRGFCTLRPQVPGLSENIRVISVIGRFLEHSRIFYFRNAQADELEGDFFIGSADWMYRNLCKRVEAVVPVEGKPQRQRLWQILQIMLSDKRQAWDMLPDGRYVQRTPQSPAEAHSGTHHVLMQLHRHLGRA
ncbi:MAG: polyphosphate kinase [Tepidisphaerales bacterium]